MKKTSAFLIICLGFSSANAATPSARWARCDFRIRDPFVLAESGPWLDQRPLYAKDGGHGMVFRRFDGRPVLTLHQPNSSPNERMKLYSLQLSPNGFSLGD